MALLGLLVVGLATAQTAPAKPDELPRGTLIEKITCQENPSQSYSLYLPSGYQPGRAWPILYVFDARGQGKAAATVFQKGAERFGWIVASSNNSMSDGEFEPNVTALRALWTDTHARLAVDDRRVYMAGYSGTVRTSILLSLAAPGTVVGILGAGAGFPFDRPPTKDIPFDFFGTVGDRDFNFYEMAELEEKLSGLGLPHRIEGFEGGHDWPPSGLAEMGIGWMELRAMKRGLREKDQALIDALWTADLEGARRGEAAGRLFEAHHAWTSLAADYAGFKDVTEAERKRAEIGASAALRREVEARNARIRRDTAYLKEAPGVLRLAMAPDPDATPPTAARIAAELRLEEWKKRRESSDREESLSAHRVLNTILGQTGSYLPRMLAERKDYDGAILMLSVNAEIRPDNPNVWVQIASLHARKGKGGRKQSMEALEKAVQLGFANRSRIESDPSFEGMREDEKFREILGKMTSPPGPLSHLPPSPRERGRKSTAHGAPQGRAFLASLGFSTPGGGSRG
jgi:predicted esterase